MLDDSTCRKFQECEPISPDREQDSGYLGLGARQAGAGGNFWLDSHAHSQADTLITAMVSQV